MAISYLDHMILDSSYILHQGEKKSIPVNLSGGITVSQDNLPGKINVEYRVQIGDESSMFSLDAKTLTIFSYDQSIDLEEEKIKAECLPISLNKTREDVETLLKDHGITNMILPDFYE